MSMFSKAVGKIGKGARKLVTNPKKWAENAGRSVGGAAKVAAPFLPPGFREAAALGGDVLAGGNMKSHATSLLGAEIGSAMGGRSAGQSFAGGARKLLGAGGGIPQVTSGGVPLDVGSLIGVTGEQAPEAAGGGGGVMGSIVGAGKRILGGGGEGGGGGGLIDYAKNHLGDIAVGGLAAMDAANAARASKRQGQLSDEMLQMAKDRWNSGQKLRDMGTAGLTRPIDFNAVYADPTNPFAQRPAAPAVADATGIPLRGRRLLAAGGTR
jgi:hypothetical protein